MRLRHDGEVDSVRAAFLALSGPHEKRDETSHVNYLIPVIVSQTSTKEDMGISWPRPLPKAASGLWYYTAVKNR